MDELVAAIEDIQQAKPNGEKKPSQKSQNQQEASDVMMAAAGAASDKEAVVVCLKPQPVEIVKDQEVIEP